MDARNVDQAAERNEVLVPCPVLAIGKVEYPSRGHWLADRGECGGGDIILVNEVADAVALGAEVSQAACPQHTGKASHPLLAAGTIDDPGPQDRDWDAARGELLRDAFALDLGPGVAAGRRGIERRALQDSAFNGAVDRHGTQQHQPLQVGPGTGRLAQQTGCRNHVASAREHAAHHGVHALERIVQRPAIRCVTQALLAAMHARVNLPHSGDRTKAGLGLDHPGDRLADEPICANDKDGERGTIPTRHGVHAAGPFCRRRSRMAVLRCRNTATRQRKATPPVR